MRRQLPGAQCAAAASEGERAAIHGLVGCSDWTGVRLSTLLDEAGVDPAAKWLLAEGADASGMSRSVPLAKAMDDALLCLYQNGERVRPSNGYPLRLLLPGFEGNMNVKWLRRIKLVDAPAMTKDETSKYTVLLKDGKAWQFVFPMEVKSMITQPSPGMTLKGPGFYEISGLAWSGNGTIKQVEVSADGGKSWAPAALSGPVLPKALTRFRVPWRWDGGPAVLQSRATDDTGMVQPTRAQLIAERGPRGALPLQRDRELGHQRQGGGGQCLRVTLSACAACFSRSLQPLRANPAVRPADRARRCRALGHQHRPRRRGSAAGQGTAKQGEAVYAAKCQACHGEKGAGKPNDQLVGGHETIKSTSRR